MQLPVSHQTLCIGEHLPTQVAFVVFLSRVHGEVLGEVERLTEHFATNVTGVGLLPCVDAVVAPEGLCPPEAFATDLTAVRSF